MIHPTIKLVFRRVYRGINYSIEMDLEALESVDQLDRSIDLEARDRGESVAQWLKERRERLFRKALSKR